MGITRVPIWFDQPGYEVPPDPPRMRLLSCLQCKLIEKSGDRVPQVHRKTVLVISAPAVRKCSNLTSLNSCPASSGGPLHARE